jgi:hypothetical protein
MRHYLIALCCLGAFILFVSSVPDDQPRPRFHTPAELASLQQRMHSPLVPGQWYLTSASCRGCHGYDTLGLANVNENGEDVNLLSHWESSMMALSTKDPLWRAKVRQEILVNPGHAAELQDKCTSCHAPMGHYNSQFRGNAHYGLADLYTDSLGLDGVSCAGCHTIDSTVGSTFSGHIPYDTSRTIYGPFTFPMTGPMQLYEGYTPTYSAHMDRSAVCSSCHTLITNTADLNGNATGGQFVEQATYHEYLNSSFPASNIKCQTCHMPQLPDPVVIANGYIALTPRYPFNQHTFAGANHFMLKLIRDNKAALDVQVADERFDSTLAATAQNLQERSVDLSVIFDSTASDTSYYRVRLENKTGHKFPSGYPSRRAVLQFIVLDQAGDTVFASGTFDSNARVPDEDAGFEPHHNLITRPDQAQIYEMVMGDVNYDFTSVLERAAHLLKDNRIPPAGFTTAHYAYDTVAISPDALADPDFNKANGTEGTAVDFVHFHVPLQGAVGPFRVITSLYYQSVPPKWLDEMFTLSSAEIDTFRHMFQNADKTPFLMLRDSQWVNTTSVRSIPARLADVYPTVTSGAPVLVRAAAGNHLLAVDVYSASGAKLRSIRASENSDSLEIDLNGAPGYYFLRIRTERGDTARKVLLNR